MSKSLMQFPREVKQEGQKVTWPTRKEVTTTTIIVFIMILLCADFVISSGVEFILGK